MGLLLISVINYDARFAPAFAELNKEWIETWFELETEDIKVLSNPESYVLAGGGEIFFALDAQKNAVGTVAMVNAGSQTFELAKMAVAPKARGQGISHLLMSACIDFARARKAREIFLITNDILLPAMHLYESSGFVRQPQNNDSRYARGNTEMRLPLVTDSLVAAEADLSGTC